VNELKDFFGASVGAAAALIGLLFVAITIAPDKVFGRGAQSEKRGQAIGAFVALGNVFFVSLAGLLPRSAPQVIIVLALISMSQILREGRTMARLFPERRGWRRFGLISFGIYLLELLIATRLLARAGNPEGIVFTVLGLYAYALGTSWSLLGARDANEGLEQ
jgi:hypothetical protein